MRVKDIVSKDPNVLGGKLVFAGTRVPVVRLVSYLQKDYTLTRFLKGFPTVTRRQAQAFLELGMDRVEELIDQQQAARESASPKPEHPEETHARAA